MAEPTVPELFEAAGRQLLQEFRHIRETNPHSGEKGSETEDVLRRFLNQHLPQRFRATSGILIDSENRRSRQTDVIVYDALSSPIYRASERLQILPAHTTAAIVEVKSELTSATLRDGYEKIKSCKMLRHEPMRPVDRSATGTSLDVTGMLGVIFAFSSELSLSTIGESVAKLNTEYDSDHWPDVIVVLDRGLVSYGTSPPGTHAPMHRFGARAPASESSCAPPPYYIRILVGELGDATLNHFFLILLAHLTFFPLRAGLPHFDILVGSASSNSMVLDSYQFDLSGKLRPTPREFYGASTGPSASIQVAGPDGQPIGVLEYSKWQDAGFVWWSGRVPLAAILRAVLADVSRVLSVKDISRPGTEMSSLLPVTEDEFRRWPELLAAKSNLSARVTL